MGDVAPVKVQIPEMGSACELWKWPAVNAGDNCLPVQNARFPDCSVQFIKGGAFGGNMSLQVSNDPSASGWDTAKDDQGTAISGINQDGAFRTVKDHGYLLRPVAGAGVASVNVFLKLASGGR